MYKLDYPVSMVSKVGPKYKSLLDNLEIRSIEDLLRHFPFRYDDFSVTKSIAELQAGENVTIEAMILSIDNIFTKNGKRLTKAVVSDHSGKIQIIWFNQHYLSNSIKKNRRYKFSGKADLFSNKLTLISPEHELSSENTLNTGRLVPIYPETAGVSSKWLRSRINDVLTLIPELDEFIPNHILNKHNLIKADESIRKIHFPTTFVDVNKARNRLGYEELFLELLGVELRKNLWGNKAKTFQLHHKHKKEMDKFVESLPFKLTDSQQTSVTQIIENMGSEHPMNRILEGDVGTGKTIVAVISAYLCYLNGYKTLYMAPTEILANQHFETFLKYLNSFGPKIELITGSKKPNENNWDILIGTHALLYSKENLGPVGLVIIDEQHRFGVEQRAKLSQINQNKVMPHLLSMTATPIPRTLALTLFGDLDISTLKTPPNVNKKIITTVIPDKQRENAYKLIRDKGEPTFIVCPLIEESESTSFENVKAAEVEYEKLKNGVFKGISMGLLHGRMSPKDKQAVVEKFKLGEIKILVSTPVIEVGIDVPEATVMVIESAERYGLASLHQLRGRVGRGDKPGFCLIFMSNDSKSSYERLKNLERVSNGLELAEIDMKMRGQGDLYGTMQHGFKQFKIANINDLELLEKAKQDAVEVFKEIDMHPKLKEKLDSKTLGLISKN